MRRSISFPRFRFPKKQILNHAALRQTTFGHTLGALSGSQARTLRREATSFLRVGLGNPATRFCFFAQNGAFIVNFPKQHMDNCTRKHQLTDGMFKPLVRILKNIRRHLIDLGTIQRELAPGYFLECLLYNVPDGYMTGTYSEAFVRSMRWLAAADRSNFECASGQVRLFGDRIVPSWRTENCDRFLQAVGTLWDRW